MESVIKLSALNPRSIEIRLIEGRDEAYILVNEDYFSLGTGQKLNISSTSSLQEGVNLLNLMIKTYPLKERILRGLFGQDWCGRFELYIDGKLRGTYNKSGGELMGSGKYTVAKIELNINLDPTPTEYEHGSSKDKPGSTPDDPDLIKKQLLSIINRLQKIKGMNPTHFQNVGYSTPYIILENNIKINVWKNLAEVDHVFLIDPEGNCCFAGYVSWVRRKKFYRALQQIRNDFPGV